MNTKQKILEGFDKIFEDNIYTLRCTNISADVKHFLSKALDEVEKENKKRLECLELAHEELLELRGFLLQRGKFCPDIDELEKYLSSPKPQWEINLSDNK